MRRPALPLTCLAAIIVLFVVACGGDDSSEGGEQLPTGEYVAAADAICAEAQGEIDALESTAEDEFRVVLEAGVAIQEDQLERLRALGVPEELEEQTTQAYELLEQLNAIARDVAETFSRGDIERTQELVDEGEVLNSQLEALADEIGLTTCGA